MEFRFDPNESLLENYSQSSDDEYRKPRLSQISIDEGQSSCFDKLICCQGVSEMCCHNKVVSQEEMMEQTEKSYEKKKYSCASKLVKASVYECNAIELQEA